MQIFKKKLYDRESRWKKNTKAHKVRTNISKPRNIIKTKEEEEEEEEKEDKCKYRIDRYIQLHNTTDLNTQAHTRRTNISNRNHRGGGGREV